MNPSKRNNLFIWTEEWSRAVNSLTLMRQEDPLFHKKLRTLSANYDSLGKPAVQREMRTHAEELQAYAEVRCLTLNELWMKRLEEWRAWRERLGREMSTKSSNKTEKRIANWRTYQRNLKKRGELPDERVAILEAISYWTWGNPHPIRDKPYNYAEIANEYRAFRERLGRDPRKGSLDPTERRLGDWMSLQRNSKRLGTLRGERIALLEAIPDWTWGNLRPIRDKPYDYAEIANEFRAMRERLGRDPKQTATDPSEKRMARWLATQRHLNKRGELPADRVAIVEAIPGWMWAVGHKKRV